MTLREKIKLSLRSHLHASCQSLPEVGVLVRLLVSKITKTQSFNAVKVERNSCCVQLSEGHLN